MVQIRLNGETRDIEPDTDLEQLVQALALSSQRIAIELNGKVVTRPSWKDIALDDGDRLEVVHFVGGG